MVLTTFMVRRAIRVVTLAARPLQCTRQEEAAVRVTVPQLRGQLIPVVVEAAVRPGPLPALVAAVSLLQSFGGKE